MSSDTKEKKTSEIAKVAESKVRDSESCITIYIPAEGNGDFVDGCLNGKNFRIKTGVMVEVPPYIARILTTSNHAQRMSERMAAGFAGSGGKKVG